MASIQENEIQEIFLATLKNCCCNPNIICEYCFFKYDHNSPRNKTLTFDLFSQKEIKNCDDKFF